MWWLLLLTIAGRPLWAQVQQPVRQLSLAQALEIAGDESEAVGVARAGIDAARGEQRRARSEFFPQLSGSANYTRTLETQFAALAEEEEGDSSPVAPPSSCPLFISNPAATPDERLAALE
ncbi:MAG TPA: hypothetical protein VFZ87_13030, partial [Gemmatimonadales bacterium]